MSTARVAALCYVVTIAAGMVALLVRGSVGATANVIAMLAYVAVTVLFTFVFAPVHLGISRLAAAVGLGGCAAAGFAARGVSVPIDPLAIFGIYCLLLGWLAVRSTFVATTIGVLLMVGGLSWLTFAWPALARMLAPYNFVPGIVAETALTGWLLVYGGVGGRSTAGASTTVR